MAFVLDASIALAWPMRDEQSDFANQVQDRLRDEIAVVPSHWLLEVVNGLLMATRRGRLSPADVAQATEFYLGLPVSVREMAAEEVFGIVLNLAREQQLSSSDAAYLNLAMREGLPLATLDVALKAAAERVGVMFVE